MYLALLSVHDRATYCSILILLSFPAVPINIYTTHEASKLATPLRFITLLPCPADQSSATLKSVQWNCVDPISRPGQPRSHVMVPRGPIKVPADTVLALQKVSSLDLRQEIRCVKTIYKCNRLLVVLVAAILARSMHSPSN